MSNKEFKALDVKLHNFMREQRGVNKALADWAIYVERTKFKKNDTTVCMSAFM